MASLASKDVLMTVTRLIDRLWSQCFPKPATICLGLNAKLALLGVTKPAGWSGQFPGVSVPRDRI